MFIAWQAVCGAVSAWGADTSAAAGEMPKVIVENCVACHGPGLKGAMGPALIPLRAELAKDEKALLAIIQNGNPDKGMPPADAITPADAALISAYLQKTAAH